MVPFYLSFIASELNRSIMSEENPKSETKSERYTKNHRYTSRLGDGHVVPILLLLLQ